MPRIKAVIYGGCQVPGIGLCLKELAPQLDLTIYPLGSYPSEDARNRIAATLPDYDLVFANKMRKTQGMGNLAAEKLTVPAVLFPAIAFRGFHADFHYLRVAGKLLPSPSARYQSMIAAAAFRLGLSQPDTVRLYNTYVFKLLGYDGLFAAEWEALTARHAGFDMTVPFSPGAPPFMHTFDHPAIAFMYDFARQLADKAGLSPPDREPPPDLCDRLAVFTRLAVYPDFAEMIDVAPREFERDVRLAAAGQRSLPLRDYIAAAFKIYEAADPAYFEQDIVRDTAQRIADGWIGSSVTNML
ncbi:MAG: WcbI family polysaccharide biosynthesis putative acetyltransferase [Magnetospiraceae bacterium]